MNHPWIASITRDFCQVTSDLAGWDPFLHLDALSQPPASRIVAMTSAPYQPVWLWLLSKDLKGRFSRVPRLRQLLILGDNSWYILRDKPMDDQPLLRKCTWLREPTRKWGLLTRQQLVLWHWDFIPQNIHVDRTPNKNWGATTLIDWDEVLCVPQVLTRNPPAWLWEVADQTDQGSGDGDDRLPIPRKLTSLNNIK